MARETKVGLLIGVGVILLVAIIVNDHLVTANQENAPTRADDLAGQTGLVYESQASLSGPSQAAARPPLRRTRAPSGGSRQSRRYSNQLSSRRISPLGRPGVRIRAKGQETRQSRPNSARPSGTRGDAAPQRGSRRRLDVQSKTDGTQRIAQPEVIASPGQANATAQSTQTDSDSSQLPAAVRIGSNAISRLGGQLAAGIQATAGSSSQPSSHDPSEPTARRPSSPNRTTDRSTGSRIIHYVKAGESLTELAQRYYDNSGYWKRIAAANPDQVGDQGQVVEGARLVIPNKAGLAEVGRSIRRKYAQAEKNAAQSATSNRDGQKTITVKSGDSLSQLAQEHLGDSARWPALYEANRDRLDSKNDLTVGMSLSLPAASVQADGQAQQASVPSNQSYTVKKNDTLYDIAEQQLGEANRWREILEANRDTLSSPDALEPGKVLSIPAGE